MSSKVMHPYWPKFFPSSILDGNNFIRTLYHHDTSEIRCAVLELFIEMLDGSKSYLQMADESASSSSFVSLSSRLTQMSRTLHEILFKLSKNETDLCVQNLAFKCLQVLIQNSNYDKTKELPEIFFSGYKKTILNRKYWFLV
jgi:hypothetical protein